MPGPGTPLKGKLAGTGHDPWKQVRGEPRSLRPGPRLTGPVRAGQMGARCVGVAPRPGKLGSRLAASVPLHFPSDHPTEVTTRVGRRSSEEIPDDELLKGGWYGPSRTFSPATPVCAVMALLLIVAARVGAAEGADEDPRPSVGWGWQDRPHGPTLASDVLGQFVDGDPARPNFGGYGPYGGPKPHAFFFFAFNAGRYQVAGGLAAHRGIGKLAVPDYWNHRVLLFDLRGDGSLAGRGASGLIGQERFDQMEIGQGPARFHYPSACAFDPAGKYLFVADEYNHRVLQFEAGDPRRAVRVYGQRDFDSWGIDATAGDLIWDSTREDVRGPKLARDPNARGMFLPRGVASDGRRLFVSDGDNHRVLVFDANGTDNGPEAVSVLGQEDFAGYRPNRGRQAEPADDVLPRRAGARRLRPPPAGGR